MKNEDKSIPVTRVTLYPPLQGGAARNKTVIRVSGTRRPDGQPKRNSLFPPAAASGEGTTYYDPKKSGGIMGDMDKHLKKPGGFSEEADNRPNMSGDIWAAMDNRPDKPEGFAGASGEYEINDSFYSHDPGRSRGKAKKSYARELPDEGPVFSSFIVELIFSVLLLASVCALRTVHINAENAGFISFHYPGNSLWAYMCISAAVFALLRIFFRMQYFAAMFVAFGAFFVLNFNWLTDLSLLLFSEGAAVIGAFVMYFILLAGFFCILWLLYNKGLKPRLFVKIAGGATAILVLANLGVNWPL